MIAKKELMMDDSDNDSSDANTSPRMGRKHDADGNDAEEYEYVSGDDDSLLNQKFQTDSVIEFSKLSEAEQEQLANLLIESDMKAYKDPEDGMWTYNIQLVEPPTRPVFFHKFFDESDDVDDKIGKSGRATTQAADLQGTIASGNGKVNNNNNKNNLKRNVNKQRKESLSSSIQPGQSRRKKDGLNQPRRKGSKIVIEPNQIPQIQKDIMYPRLSILLMSSLGKFEPQGRSLSWLRKTIEEIYDARYVHDMIEVQQEAKEQSKSTKVPIKKSTIGSIVPKQFPDFVIEFLTKRYGLKRIVERQAWDLLYTVHSFRKNYTDIELFARFLEESYALDDLYFFGLFRHECYRIIKSSVQTAPSSAKKKSQSIEDSQKGDAQDNLLTFPFQSHITRRQVFTIARRVYKSAEGLEKAFLDGLYDIMDEKNVNSFEAIYILQFAVQLYSKTRELFEQGLYVIDSGENDIDNQDRNFFEDMKQHQREDSIIAVDESVQDIQSRQKSVLSNMESTLKK